MDGTIAGSMNACTYCN